MIPNEVIDDILKKADIVQVISNYINVIKKGNSYVAICPFHNDTNPSLSISRTKQIYKCFVCGSGGNVFTFVSNYEKISFLDAVRKVAEIINYTSPYLEKQERRVSDRTRSLLKALDDTAQFYHYVLSAEAGREGKKYLEEREIQSDMIDYFSLGFSPDNGEMTIRQLRAKGNDVAALEGAGILLREGSSFSDRFHGRVMFPIRNEFGETVGFSGRKIGAEDAAKYVNSPATDLFNKSGILYNYHNARNEAKEENCCYIVEGFMDVFALYRIGIKSCVALMGTAFTKQHAKLLRRLNVELRLCLDGDNAGRHGMMNMCALLDEEHISYRFVDYRNDERDPDEILKQEGKESLRALADRLIPKSVFLLDYFASQFDLKTTEGKNDFIRAMAEATATEDPAINSEISGSIAKKIQEYDAVNETRVSSLFAKYAPEKKSVTLSELKPIEEKKSGSAFVARALQRQILYYMITSEEACDIVRKYPNVVFIGEIYPLLENYIAELRTAQIGFSVADLIVLIQSSGGDQKLIDEATAISELKSVPPYDPEVLNECLSQMRIRIQSNQEKQEFYDHAFGTDEITRARMLDKRRKGVN